MRRLLQLLLLVVVAAGIAGWMATRPAAASGVQPSEAAAVAAKAKLAAAFGIATARAFLTQTAQEASVQLSDEEITSLAAARVSGGGPVTNPSVRGRSDGVFEVAGDTVWNGWTFHLDATGTVAIDSQGAVHLDVHGASVGLLPLPASVLQALADQAASEQQVNLPPNITDLRVHPVDGGALVTGTANP